LYIFRLLGSQRAVVGKKDVVGNKTSPEKHEQNDREQSGKEIPPLNDCVYWSGGFHKIYVIKNEKGLLIPHRVMSRQACMSFWELMEYFPLAFQLN
jgi:hypothetical protein